MKKLLFLSLALICSGPILGGLPRSKSCKRDTDCTRVCELAGYKAECQNGKCSSCVKVNPIIPILPIEPGPVVPEQSKGSTEEEFDDGSTQTIFVGN